MTLIAQTNTFPASGNVGIGTTSPTAKLQIGITDGGSVNQGIELDRSGAATTKFSMKLISDAGGYYRGALEFTQNGGALTEVISIGNEAGGGPGNVGIGTTNPSTSGGGGSPRTLEIQGKAGQTVPWGQLVLSSPVAGATNDVLGGIEFASRGVSTYPRSGYIYSFKEDASTTAATARLEFGVTNGDTAYTAMTVRATGNVGIGTTNPTQKLSVNGTIQAKEVVVQTNWSDYVFAPDYRLPALSTVEAHIKAEKHLPGIPSAQEVAEHGISLGDMQAKLLAKIEEITLHQIAQEKRMETLAAENAALRAEVESLKQTR